MTTMSVTSLCTTCATRAAERCPIDPIGPVVTCRQWRPLARVAPTPPEITIRTADGVYVQMDSGSVTSLCTTCVVRATKHCPINPSAPVITCRQWRPPVRFAPPTPEITPHWATLDIGPCDDLGRPVPECQIRPWCLHHDIDTACDFCRRGDGFEPAAQAFYQEALAGYRRAKQRVKSQQASRLLEEIRAQRGDSNPVAEVAAAFDRLIDAITLCLDRFSQQVPR